MTETMKTTNFSASLGWGYGYVMLAAVLWGVSGSSAKFLFNRGLSAFQLVQLRLTIAAGIMFLCILIRNPSLFRISRKDIGYFVILGTAGMASVQFTYLFAISKIHVAAAILLQDMAPAIIAVYSLVFARESLSRTTLLAMIGSGAGCYLLVGAYNLDILSMNSAGITAGLLSAAAFATYSLMGEYGMRRYGPWTVLFYALLFAAALWNIVRFPLEAFFHSYSSTEWVLILYIAILGTLVPFGLFLEGINLIRSARASITVMLEPIIAGILSYIFLHEVMEPLQLTGGVLVIASVVLLQMKQEYDDKTPDILRAKYQNEKDRL